MSLPSKAWTSKKSHRVLFGRDPVADLEIPMNLHRVEVEHELRAATIETPAARAAFQGEMSLK